MGGGIPEAALVKEAERLLGEAVRLSRAIHERPELGFQETAASALLCDFLESRGFAVERGVAGLATAFRAVRGDEAAPAVAFLAEYDALPGLGHACGHNLIAAASLSRIACCTRSRASL